MRSARRKLAGGLDALIELAQKPVTKKLIARAGRRDPRDRQVRRPRRRRPRPRSSKIIDREPPEHPQHREGQGAGPRARREVRPVPRRHRRGDQRARRSARPERRRRRSCSRCTARRSCSRRSGARSSRAGPAAEDELRKILRGEQPEVEPAVQGQEARQVLRRQGRREGRASRCRRRTSTRPSCSATSTIRASVPDLLAALERPTLPQYYSRRSAEPGLDAVQRDLRRAPQDRRARAAPTRCARCGWPVGATAGAREGQERAPRRLRPAAAGEPDNSATRILAIGAYPFVDARRRRASTELGKIAADNDADDKLRHRGGDRVRAALARRERHRGPRRPRAEVLRRVRRRSARKPTASRRPTPTPPTRSSRRRRRSVDDAKADALKATHDPIEDAPRTSRRRPTRAKKAEDDFKVAKKKHKDATRAVQGRRRRGEGLQGLRAHVPDAHRAHRGRDPLQERHQLLRRHAQDDAGRGGRRTARRTSRTSRTGPRTRRPACVEGEVERAMLEIGKHGPKAAALDRHAARRREERRPPDPPEHPARAAEDREGPVRQLRGRSSTRRSRPARARRTLGDLNLETTMLRNYFAWAGGKTPTVSTDVPDAPAPAAPPKKKK